MNEDLKNIPSKVNLEIFDINNFSKDKIRDLFRSGKVPTAEVMIDEILLRSIKAEATDLHFEPTDNELRIRYGSEGVLKRLVSLPKDIADNLSSVIKTKAGLNAFEKKKPQEGRFSLTLGNHQFDIRVSTIPVMAGERFALRILAKSNRVANLEELGFSAENFERIRKIINKPIGLFLVTGPSNSGKSTTIYASVNDIQSPEKNIITVENPVEYKLDYASQVQPSTDKSFTYVDALRAILRQNPNVIMLGEIRDAETGIVAAEAALYGNLVLSTILSNDAVGAILRLLSLGVPTYWVASSLIGVVHQQLVRKICPDCKEEYKPTDQELARFNASFPEPAKFYHGKGCDQCKGTGYHGRTAIHEILCINDQIRDLIYLNSSMLTIKETARSLGFENIYEDAVKKLRNGITTIQEIQRAFG
jgi:type II secretory ATPase GspE/PulE/Tfp pilus assembly ATPase PilB-like protein